MKILYIITQADGGGAQKYVLSLAKHFQGEIAAGNEAEKLFKEAHKGKLKTHTLKHLKRDINIYHDFLAIWEIRSLIKKISPDIVHLNSTKAGFLGTLAAKGLKPKLIFTAHGFRFSEPLIYPLRLFYLVLEKIASKYRDFIISVSDSDKEAAIKNKVIAPEKIQTIYNGIPKLNFLPREEARKKLGLPLDKKVIIAIANDYPTKGLDILEKAATFKPISGTLTAVIGKVAEDKKSNDNIKFLGYKEAAFSFIKASDVVVIPSRKEGFPFVALEAMQAGATIVATKVGGMPEALQNAASLVPPENPDLLHDSLETLMEEEDVRKELSNKALERSKEFTEEKMLKETEEIYRQVLAK